MTEKLDRHESQEDLNGHELRKREFREYAAEFKLYFGLLIDGGKKLTKATRESIVWLFTPSSLYEPKPKKLPPDPEQEDLSLAVVIYGAALIKGALAELVTPTKEERSALKTNAERYLHYGPEELAALKRIMSILRAKVSYYAREVALGHFYIQTLSSHGPPVRIQKGIVSFLAVLVVGLMFTSTSRLLLSFATDFIVRTYYQVLFLVALILAATIEKWGAEIIAHDMLYRWSQRIALGLFGEDKEIKKQASFLRRKAKPFLTTGSVKEGDGIEFPFRAQAVAEQIRVYKDQILSFCHRKSWRSRVPFYGAVLFEAIGLWHFFRLEDHEAAALIPALAFVLVIAISTVFAAKVVVPEKQWALHHRIRYEIAELARLINQGAEEIKANSEAASDVVITTAIRRSRSERVVDEISRQQIAVAHQELSEINGHGGES